MHCTSTPAIHTGSNAGYAQPSRGVIATGRLSSLSRPFFGLWVCLVLLLSAAQVLAVPVTAFEPAIGSEGAAAPVCPQNRAYGSVHGSSRKTYPLRNLKPMRHLSVGSDFLSHQIDEPTVRVGSRDRSGVGE